MPAGATEDKSYMSSRVAWSGAGINLKTVNSSQGEIRQTVRHLIIRPEFRDRALALNESIRRSDALASIGTEVEELLEISPVEYETVLLEKRLIRR
jgi:UDP:flavonoid glycosyltransferase YjiC (YdhE family)